MTRISLLLVTALVVLGGAACSPGQVARFGEVTGMSVTTEQARGVLCTNPLSIVSVLDADRLDYVLGDDALGPCSQPPAAEPDSPALVAWINDTRAGAGLAGLTAHPDLGQRAQAWADHLARTGQLAHSEHPAQLLAAWTTTGENVGVASTLRAAHDQLVGSPPHRANLLAPAYTSVGVGVATDAAGTLWVVELFAG